MIALAVIPQPGANYVEIANDFYKRLNQLKNELPADFTLNVSLTRPFSLRIRFPK
jgi:multidrug efflux pump subunit AcrB